MTVATIAHQKREQAAHAGKISAIGDRSPLALSVNKTAARQYCYVRRQRVVGTPDCFCDGTRRKPVGFFPHEQLENGKARRLAERCQRRQSARCSHLRIAVFAFMPDDGLHV